MTCRRPTGRQGLDTAEGVLIALRRYTSDEAFREIIWAAEHHRVPVFALADALVAAASGGRSADGAAGSAVVAQWGALLAEPARTGG